MKYYRAKRSTAMIFYPNGMKYLHRGELLTEAELRKYGIEFLDNFEVVEIKKTETYRTHAWPLYENLLPNGRETRMLRFA